MPKYSSLVVLYASEIAAGNMTIDEVPAGLRDKVQAALDAAKEKVKEVV